MNRDPRHVGELGKTGVMRACLDLLAVHRIWHRRMNSGFFVAPATETTKRRAFRAGSTGMADILATPWVGFVRPCAEARTAILWIECKSSTGRQRPEQEEFQTEVVLAGHHYLIVRDVDQLVAWLRQHGVIA